jgi:hypothetical protein
MLELKFCVIEQLGWTDKPQERFIGVDESSGGYPTHTDLTGAKIWYNPEKAKEYIQVFARSEESNFGSKNWIVKELLTGAQL